MQGDIEAGSLSDRSGDETRVNRRDRPRVEQVTVRISWKKRHDRIVNKSVTLAREPLQDLFLLDIFFCLAAR